MNFRDRSNWNDKHLAKKSSPCAMAMRGNARFALKGLAVSLMLAFGPSAYALPVGGVVAAGGASISSAAGSTTITQSTQNAAINWQSFSIGQGEAVNFMQPGSNSVALNRVLGADPSSILGSMSANGKVFLVNPNGILFGKGAQVNVGGLVASTLNITDSDFMAGRYQFAGTSGASILNQGSINADGGYVALLGANVGNDGTIVARLGTVALAAGNAITLDVVGDGLLNVTVNQGAVNALVQNGGLIQADGGQVLLTAMAAGTLLQSAVNNIGVIQAQTIENRNGTIRLLGDMQGGTVNVGGTLDASAPNGGNGGFIEASAAHVNIASDVVITSAAPTGSNGTFLIDPQDFTVGSAAGNNITGATLSGLLVTNSVVISTNIGTDAVVAGTPPVSSRFSGTVGNGDIFVNEAVAWTAAPSPTTLTLNAARDVFLNAAISPTNGNLVVCCGRNVNVNAAITTTTPGGSILLSAGNNVNVNAAITATSGNITLCAGNNVDLMGAPAAITLVDFATSPALSLGLANGLVLSAGTNGTGSGTVIFRAGTPPAAITRAPVNIYYNPVSYTTPTNYSTGAFFTLVGPGAPLTEYMLVFPDGGSKVADGSTLTTFTGLKGAPAGVTLAGAGVANFDTADVGTGKTITFTGFTLTQGPILTGGTAINYALANSCCGPIVGRTTATITAAPPPPPPPIPPILPVPLPPFLPVPPVAVIGIDTAPDVLGEEMLGREREVQEYLPVWSPTVAETRTPPQLLSVAPPVVVLPPPPVIVPPVYVPPVLPPKQDRN